MSAISPAVLLMKLSQACECAGGQSAWARVAGIPPSVVSETLARKREPSEAIANALGFLRVVTFIPGFQVNT
jgi:hypothetical protein